MTVGVVSVKASATILGAAVGADINMVDTELLFAIEARLAGRNTAHEAERQGVCIRRAGSDEYVRPIRGRDTGGRGSVDGDRKLKIGTTRKIIAAWGGGSDG